MMKSNKGKTNFWSQLLLSMIAIFACLLLQGLEAPPSSNMSGENYQTSSEQHMLIAVREIRQALQVQPQPTNHKTHSNQNTKNSTALYRGRVSCFCPYSCGSSHHLIFFLSLNEPIFNRMILLFFI